MPVALCPGPGPLTGQVLQAGEVVVGDVVELKEPRPKGLAEPLDHARDAGDIVVGGTDEGEKALDGVQPQEAHPCKVESGARQRPWASSRTCFSLSDLGRRSGAQKNQLREAWRRWGSPTARPLSPGRWAQGTYCESPALVSEGRQGSKSPLVRSGGQGRGGNPTSAPGAEFLTWEFLSHPLEVGVHRTPVGVERAQADVQLEVLADGPQLLWGGPGGRVRVWAVHGAVQLRLGLCQRPHLAGQHPAPVRRAPLAPPESAEHSSLGPGLPFLPGRWGWGAEGDTLSTPAIHAKLIYALHLHYIVRTLRGHCRGWLPPPATRA